MKPLHRTALLITVFAALPDEPVDTINAGYLSQLLGNPMTKGSAMKHPYHYVVFASCCAGRGAMSRAFGIPHEKCTVEFFKNKGLRSRAFIGNTAKDGADGSLGFVDGQGQPTVACIQEEAGWYRLLKEYRGGVKLAEALADAKRTRRGAAGIDPNFEVFGATDMLRNSP